MAHISNEQEVIVKQMHEKFKRKGNIYGDIHIKFTNNGYKVDDKPIISEIDGDEEAYDRGHTDGKSVGLREGRALMLQELSDLNAIDLYENLGMDATLVYELVAYHKSRE